MISLYLDHTGKYLDVSVPVSVAKQLKSIGNQINWGGDVVVFGIERQVAALEAVARATAKEKGETLYASDTTKRGPQASKHLRAYLSYLTTNDCIPRWSLEAEDLGQPNTQKLVSGQFEIDLGVQLWPSPGGNVAGVLVVDWATGDDALNSLKTNIPKEEEK